MIAAIVSAGFLVAAVTSNAAFAQTSSSGPSTIAGAISSILQIINRPQPVQLVLQILFHATNMNKL
jgi:hypothetical protein